MKCGKDGNLPPVVESLQGAEIRDLFDYFFYPGKE